MVGNKQYFACRLRNSVRFLGRVPLACLEPDERGQAVRSTRYLLPSFTHLIRKYKAKFWIEE